MSMTLSVYKEDFDKNIFRADYFGYPEEVFKLANDLAVVKNALGFQVMDLLTQKRIFTFNGDIASWNVDEKQGTATVFDRLTKSLYVFNLLEARIDKRIKMPKGNIIHSITTMDSYFFIYDKYVINFSNGTEQRRIDFDDEEIIYGDYINESDKLKLWIIDKNNQVCLFEVDKLFTKKETKICEDFHVDIRRLKIKDVKLINDQIIILTEKNLIDKYTVYQLHNIFEPYISNIDNFKPFVKNNKNLRRFFVEDIKDNCINKGNKGKLCKYENKIEFVLNTTHKIELLKNQQLLNFFYLDSHLMVLLSDLSLYCFDLKTKKIIWKSEEALRYVEDILIIADHSNETHWKSYDNYEQLLNSGRYFEAWRFRLQDNIIQFLEMLDLIFKNLVFIFKNLTNFKELKKGYSKNKLTEFVLSDEKAVFITSVGKIMLFNLKTREFGESFDTKLQICSDESTHCCNSHLEGKYLNFTCSYSKKHYVLNLKTMDLTESNDTLHHTKISKKYKILKDEGIIEGFYDGNLLWNINFGKDEKISDFAYQNVSIDKGTDIIPENKMVLYKIKDANNILVLTFTDKINKYTAYVVNVNSGIILKRIDIEDLSPNHPISLIVDDYSFIISYFNTNMLSYEILNIEIFRKEIETEFIDIIKNQFKLNIQYLPQIDYNAATPNYYIQLKKYGLDLNIKKIEVFKSKKDLTEKNLLISTQNNRIYSLDRQLISTRRCTEKEKQESEKNLTRKNKSKIKIENYYKSQQLLPYQYQLPIFEKNFITKDQDFSLIENIFVHPTDFESTSLIFTTGSSLFISNHSPNNVFDKLPDSFDKLKLLGLFVVLIAAFIGTKIYYTSGLASKNFLEKA